MISVRGYIAADGQLQLSYRPPPDTWQFRLFSREALEEHIQSQLEPFLHSALNIELVVKICRITEHTLREWLDEGYLVVPEQEGEKSDDEPDSSA